MMHLVVGSSGGIGGALSALLRQRNQAVLCLARSAARSSPDAIPLDLESDDSIEQAVAVVGARLEPSGSAITAIYICSGVLHRVGMRPERRIEDLDTGAFESAMRINALGPLRLLAGLKGLLPRNTPSRIAVISARVGSITDNRLGGWYSYRCSKAALNMGIRTFAVELQRSYPSCRVTLFHPGTTGTALSQPFQGNVAPEKLFSAERAARQFLDVLDRRGDVPGAVFLDWAGKPVEF